MVRMQTKIELHQFQDGLLCDDILLAPILESDWIVQVSTGMILVHFNALIKNTYIKYVRNNWHDWPTSMFW